MKNNMTVDDKLIAKLAGLAKLKFNPQAAEKIKLELKKILGFVNAISKINTDGVEPLIYLSKEKNVLRNDKINAKITQQDALKNAPQKDSDYFKVPTVLKK